VHLTPRETERLLLAAAADLARRRLARGAPLGSTEAIALVCDEICELAWDGLPLAEVIERARSVVPPAALLPGVAGLVPAIEVEALFPWGSTLVHVDAPFGPPAQAAQAAAVAPAGQDQQDDPERKQPTPEADHYPPGAVLPGAGTVELAPGAPRATALLRNTGPRDVWISSHFPLDQVNHAVQVRLAGDGPTPPGLRLDLPAGEALLLRPGEEREVTVVAGLSGHELP
jgi:urease subunit gamma/beta